MNKPSAAPVCLGPAAAFVSFVSFVSFVFCIQPAQAQIYEAVGTRAQGMGGAFVAVADDATATWWNPAGLASGPYFSTVLERSSLDDPGTPTVAGPALRDSASGIAVSFPALGLSYYRFRVSEIRPSSSTGTTDSVRQDPGAISVDLRSLALSKYGVSFGQSIGRYLVLASTLGVLRGGVASETVVLDPLAASQTGSQLLDTADNLDASSETHADVDFGAMLTSGSLRLGASMKHVTRPTFGSGDSAVTLGRQARAGIAIVSKGTTPLTLAADVDLTKTPTVDGDVQHIAAGGEAWLAKKRIGVRAGISGNLVGATRTALSSGVSVAVKSGVYLDGALTFGNDTTRSGTSITLRATF
jgi:hypothetical protein